MSLLKKQCLNKKQLFIDNKKMNLGKLTPLRLDFLKVVFSLEVNISRRSNSILI